jgi:hypothetical protein
MKFAALLLFPLLITVQSYCQNNSEKLLYVRKSETYRKVKNTGATLTVLGTISLIVGNVISHNTPDYTGPGKAPSDLHDESLIWKAAGVVCLGSGVPLWIVGAANQKKYETKLENLFVRFQINPKGGGLSLTYHF